MFELYGFTEDDPAFVSVPFTKERMFGERGDIERRVGVDTAPTTSTPPSTPPGTSTDYLKAPWDAITSDSTDGLKLYLTQLLADAPSSSAYAGLTLTELVVAIADSVEADIDNRSSSAESDAALIVELMEEQASGKGGRRVDPRALAVLQYRFQHKMRRDEVMAKVGELRGELQGGK